MNLSRIKNILHNIILFFCHFPYRRVASKTVHITGNILHNIIFKLLLPKSYRNITKKEIYTIIFKSDTPAGKKFDLWLLVAILLNLALMIIDSSPRITGWVSFALRTLEWLFTIGFTLEYYLRIYCLRKPWKYILSFYGIIDFASIFPAYLSILFPATHTLAVLRILRTLRIFRILKMQRFIHEGSRLLNALRRSAYKIVIFMMFTLITAVILGAVMYMFENEKNPAFGSIPNGIYWAVVTITTVGYGDVTPITHAGRFISIIVMLLGYSIIAVPSGIVTGEIIKENGEAKKSHKPKEFLLDDETDDLDQDEDEVLSTLESHEGDDDEEESSDSAPEPVKVCPHCGYEESDELASHCSRCGTRLNRIDEHTWLNDFFA